MTKQAKKTETTAATALLSGDAISPMNPTTGKAYQGGNVAALLAAQEEGGYSVAMWAGYGQWTKSGRQVRKGETATRIQYMVPVFDKKTKKPKLHADGTPVLRPRALCVFNIEQTDKIEETAEKAAA